MASARSWRFEGSRFWQTEEALRLKEQGIAAKSTSSTIESLHRTRSLTNVNIAFRNSELAVVLGPPRSGKSLVLSAILGEAHISSGSIHVA